MGADDEREAIHARLGALFAQGWSDASMAAALRWYQGCDLVSMTMVYRWRTGRCRISRKYRGPVGRALRYLQREASGGRR